MGKFFKNANSENTLRRDDPEIRRAISERALIKTIDPGLMRKTDSLGFFKGTTANKILKNKIPKEGFKVPFYGRVGTGIDTNKVKQVTQEYTNRLFDKKKLPSSQQVLRAAGASKTENSLAHKLGDPDSYLADFKKNVGQSWKHHKRNEQSRELAEQQANPYSGV